MLTTIVGFIEPRKSIEVIDLNCFMLGKFN